MEFTFEETNSGHNCLFVKSNQGMKISVVFLDNEEVLYLDDNIEILTKDEALFGIFAPIGEKFYSLNDIWQKAQEEMPDFLACIEREEKEWETHTESFGHPSNYI